MRARPWRRLPSGGSVATSGLFIATTSLVPLSKLPWKESDERHRRVPYGNPLAEAGEGAWRPTCGVVHRPDVVAHQALFGGSGGRDSEMSEPSCEERRWALIDQSQDYTPRWKVVNERGPAANEYAEWVEVMPVAEHEAAFGALLSERDQLRRERDEALEQRRDVLARAGSWMEGAGGRVEELEAERDQLREAAQRLLRCVDSSVQTSLLPPTHTLKVNAERLRAVLGEPVPEESNDG